MSGGETWSPVSFRSHTSRPPAESTQSTPLSEDFTFEAGAVGSSGGCGRTQRWSGGGPGDLSLEFQHKIIIIIIIIIILVCYT